MDKLIPDLITERLTGEDAEVFRAAFGVDLVLVPDAANEIAAILAAREFKLRNCGAALARVLGWLACQARDEINPEDFIKAVAAQSLNYCNAFSAQLDE